MKYEQTALDYSAITMEMLRTQGGHEESRRRRNHRLRKRSSTSSKATSVSPCWSDRMSLFDIGALQQLMNYAGLVAEFEKTFSGTKDYYGNFQPHYIDTLTSRDGWLLPLIRGDFSKLELVAPDWGGTE